MPNMHRPAGTPARVQEESLPLLVIVQDQVQVAVGEEYLAPDQICRVAYARFETLSETPTYWLGPELANETLIIDNSRYFPGSNYELFLNHLHPNLFR